MFSDMGFFGQFGFQDPATPIAVGIMKMHNDLMVVLVFVVVFVGYMLSTTIYHFYAGHRVFRHQSVHGAVIEVIWTSIPALMLMCISIPSFTLLYLMEADAEYEALLKVTGHQWYWTYQWGMFGSALDVSFDSYIVPANQLSVGDFRLLDVDRGVICLSGVPIRVLVTSSDVLHSWAVPSLGIKIDACPGRLNEVQMLVRRPGVYYGQCSELCGVDHAFMPIRVQAIG